MVDLNNIQETTGQVVNQGLGSMWMLVLIMLVVGLVFGVTFFIIWWNSFKIKFRIFIMTGSKSLIVDDFAKVIRKKGQAPKWRIRGRRAFVPVPKPDEISVDKKGRLCVEAFFTENGEYIYKKHMNEYKQDETFDPITTIDKEFFANEYIDGVLKYKKKTWAEILLQLAPIFAILIIFIMLLAFWGQIVKPFQEVGNQIIAERQADREFYLEMHDIHRIIVGNNSINGVIPPNVAPN